MTRTGHIHLRGTSQDLAANRTGAPWPHSSEDPTATKTLRSRWSAEAYRRFRALKGAVRTTVVDRDAFGIGGGENSPGPGTDTPESTGLDTLAANSPRDREVIARDLAACQGIEVEPADPNEFEFPADRKKIQAFQDWLAEQVDRGVLEVGRAERDVSAGTPWQNTYIRESYSKGVRHADAALTDMGIIAESEQIQNVFNAPKHVDGVAMVFTRAYSELQGVTEQMSQQMSRELADGLAQGENPRKIARRLNDRIDKVGISRARTIARTETVRAHNEGSLNRYGSVENRLDGLTVIAEWSTAGDNRVCVICRSFQGQQFDLSDARGRIPAHPNCRCTWVPVRREQASESEGERPVSRRVDEAIEDAENETVAIDAIDEAITDELPVENSSLTQLDPERAAQVARTLERLDAIDELEKANVRTVGTTQPTADEVAHFAWNPDGTRALRFNPDKFTEENITESIEDGWLVGDPENPLQTTVLHEVGHARHFENLRQIAENDGDTSVSGFIRDTINGNFEAITESNFRNGVSQYSAQTPGEAVAENYSRLMQGIDVTGGEKDWQPSAEEAAETIQSFYERVHGPEVPEQGVFASNATGARSPLSTNQSDGDEVPDYLAAEQDRLNESWENLLDWVEDQRDE